MDTTETNLTSKADVPSYPDLELAFFIVTRIGLLVVVAVGLPGNLIAFLVAIKKSNSHLSTCVYMAALAIADNVVLVDLLGANIFIFWGVGRDALQDRATLFRFAWYIANAAGISSGLFLAEMSVDRLVAVWAPMKATTFCTISKATKLTIVTAVITSGINLNLFWTFDYNEDPIFGIENVQPALFDEPYVSLLAPTYILVFGTIIPFAVIFLCNVGIIIGVRRAAGKRDKLMTTARKTEKAETKGRARDDAYMIRMLILVSLAYVFCSIPLRLYTVILDFLLNSTYNFKLPYWYLRYNVEHWALAMLWNVNYAINFYMYFLGGGKKFRNDAIEVLSDGCRFRFGRQSNSNL